LAGSEDALPSKVIASMLIEGKGEFKASIRFCGVVKDKQSVKEAPRSNLMIKSTMIPWFSGILGNIETSPGRRVDIASGVFCSINDSQQMTIPCHIRITSARVTPKEVFKSHSVVGKVLMQLCLMTVLRIDVFGITDQ
jgi:hypothetical protein